MRLFLAAFLLSAHAGAAGTVQRISLDVHPLLLGAPADAASPLGSALAKQALSIAGLTPSLAAAKLSEEAAGGPAQAVAAGVLAKALSEPQALPRLLSAHPALAPTLQAVQPLAAAASADSSARTSLAALTAAAQDRVEEVFEGRAPGDGLEHIVFDGGAFVTAPQASIAPARLSQLGKPKTKAGVERRAVKALGQGEFGVVYPHPMIQGAIIKVVELSAEVLLFGLGTVKPSVVAAEEEETSRAYAAIGAGPRYFERTVKDGRLVSVREQVYGERLDRMIADRKYGPEEHQLMLDLLRRMADAGIKSDDLRFPNIMIGHTETDPRPRAYVVDGGKLMPFDEGLDAEARYQELLVHPVLLMARADPFVGAIRHTRPMNVLLAEGLDRQNDRTFLKKLLRVLKDLSNQPMYGNPMR